MEKKNHLSLHHCELMGLILKFQKWSRGRVASTIQAETTGNVPEEAEENNEPGDSAEPVEESVDAENDNDGNKEEDELEEDQPLVTFRLPKRCRENSN